MPRHSLATLIRQAADPGEDDTELLGRFARDGDPAAFAELVRRYARLVWGQCRALLGNDADADDAFQATFLALARAAGTGRGADLVGPWLHAVARRVCSNARRGAARRRARERAAAVPERDAPVADAAWGAAAAALHEEVARLPKSLRESFVLCGLEGHRPDDAARSLGVPRGTFSARLSRARQLLLDRLSARGVGAAIAVAVLSGAGTDAPAAVVGRAVSLCTEGAAVPPAVLSLCPRGPVVGLAQFQLLVLATVVAVGTAVLAAVGSVPKPLTAAAVPKAEPPGKLDRHGDPLPPAAVMRLGTVRNRAPISSFGILKDGTVVTVGSDRLVRAWAPGSDRPGTPVRVGGPKLVSDYPQVSPDGRFIAVAEADKVRVWDWQRTPPAEVAVVPTGESQLLQFTPDGSKLAVDQPKGRGYQLLLCDLANGKTEAIDEGSGNLCALAFSGDGQRLAAATHDEVRVFATRDGKKLAEWRVADWVVKGLALNADGSVIATEETGQPSPVRLIDALTGKPAKGLTGPVADGPVCFAADDKTLLWHASDGVRLWDLKAGKQIGAFNGPIWNPFGTARQPPRRSPDGKTLVATNGATLFRWNAATAAPPFPESVADGHVHFTCAVGVSPDGRTFATGGHDGTVRLWDAGTGAPLRAVPARFMNEPNVEFSPDGKYLYCPSTDHLTVTKWEVATGTEVRRFAYKEGTPKRACLTGFGLTDDGRSVLAATLAADPQCRPVVSVWDADTGAVRSQAASEEVSSFARPIFSPDGKFTGSDRLYAPDDLSNPLPLKAPGLLRGFSADGRYAVSFAVDTGRKPFVATASVIARSSGRVVSTSRLDHHMIELTLSADGSVLAAATSTGVAFYDARTGKELAKHAAEMPWARAVRFTPDGKRLLISQGDTAPLVWAVPDRPAK